MEVTPSPTVIVSIVFCFSQEEIVEGTFSLTNICLLASKPWKFSIFKFKLLVLCNAVNDKTTIKASVISLCFLSISIKSTELIRIKITTIRIMLKRFIKFLYILVIKNK